MVDLVVGGGCIILIRPRLPISGLLFCITLYGHGEKILLCPPIWEYTHATERTSAWWSRHKAVCECVNLHCLPEMRQSGSGGEKGGGDCVVVFFPPWAHVFSVVVCRWREALSREFSFFKLIFFLGCSFATPWSRKNTHLTSFWRDEAISWRANVTYCVVERRASLGRRHRVGLLLLSFMAGGGGGVKSNFTSNFRINKTTPRNF